MNEYCASCQDNRSDDESDCFKSEQTEASLFSTVPMSSSSSTPSIILSGKEKICRVCGDKALGYNFNVITCESCKAFFRRNAVRNKVFRCPFNDDCEITEVSRRFCQKCRLRKCFQVGMNKELIQDEDGCVSIKKQKHSVIGKRMKTEEDQVQMHEMDSLPVTVTLPIVMSGAAANCKAELYCGSSPSNSNDRQIINLMCDGSSSSTKPSFIMINSPASTSSTATISSSAGNTLEHTQKLLTNQSSVSSAFSSITASTLQAVLALNNATLSGCSFSNATHIPSLPHPMFSNESLITDGDNEVNRNATLTSEASSFFNDSETINVSKSLIINLLSQCSSVLAICQQQQQSGFVKTLLNGQFNDRQACVCRCQCSARFGMPLTAKKCDKSTNTCPLVDTSGLRHMLNNGIVHSLSSFGSVPHGLANLSGVERQSVSTALTLASDQPIPLNNFYIGSDCISSSTAACGASSGLSAMERIPDSLFEDSVFSMLNDAIASEFGNDMNITENIVSGVSAGTQLQNIAAQTNCQANEQTHILSGSVSNLILLTPLEQAKLDELIMANEVMNININENIYKHKADQSNNQRRLIDVINMTDIAIKRIIKMSKQITAFKNMCQEDQIALLKGGCTEIMILRGVMTYSPEKESWQVSNSELIKLDILKQARRRNVYEEHKRYLQSFDAQWRQNVPIMLLLGAITLFSPTRAHVIHKHIIKAEQDSYYSLLQSYLKTQFHGCEAQSVFVQLCQKIEELHKINNNAVRIILDVNPKDVEPLLIEIFDLK